jgi:hypothetical protein
MELRSFGGAGASGQKANEVGIRLQVYILVCSPPPVLYCTNTWANEAPKYILIMKKVMTRFVILPAASLLGVINAVSVQDQFYDEFWPDMNPHEVEWGSLSSANTDTLDYDIFGYDEPPLDPGVPVWPVDLAGTLVDECSSNEEWISGILRPRGADDACSNPSAEDSPLTLPDLANLRVDSICSTKFWKLATIPVCASEYDEFIHYDEFWGTTSLDNCEASMLLSPQPKKFARHQLVSSCAKS